MKKFFKHYLLMLITILVGVAGFGLNAGMPLSQEDLMQLSPEEMNQLQEEINRQIEAEVARMSPEEQEQFYQIMANVEKIAAEDPESLERFIKGEMAEDEMASFVSAMAPDSEKPATEKSTKEAAKPESKKEPVKPLEKKLSSEELIRSCVAKIEAFLIKMQSYPELAIKVKNWAAKGLLVSLPAQKQWANVLNDLNAFIKILNTLINEKNIQKKTALLNEFSKNEVLVQSIKNLITVITESEKDVEIPLLGTEKVSKTAKQAILKIINVLTLELYGKQSTAVVEALFKAYEAEDKKIKEAEESAAKKAQQSAQAPRQKSYLKSAGKEKEQVSARQPRRSDSGYSSYNAPYRSSSRYSGYDDDYEAPRHSSSRSTTAGSGSRSSGSNMPSAAAGTRTKPGSPEIPSETKAPVRKDSSAPSPTVPQKKGSQTTQSTPRRKSQTEKLVDALGSFFDDFETLVALEKKEGKETKMVLNSHFSNLKDTILKPECDIVLANELLPQGVRLLVGGSKSILDTLKTLSLLLSKENAEIKSERKKKVEELYNLYKGTFDLLLEQIQIIDNFAEDMKKASLMNKFAFLGEALPMTQETEEEPSKPMTEEAQKAFDAIPNPTSVFVLRDAIKTVKKEVEAFIKGSMGTK